MSGIQIHNRPRLRLDQGDVVEVGVTHECNINGDKAWVRFSLSKAVGHDVDADEVADAVAAFVNHKVLAIAQRTADAVSDL